MDRLLITPPAVGEKYGGGVVTRRQCTPQGQIRLLIDGQGWVKFNPPAKMPETSGQPCKHETKVKMPETSAPDDIVFQPGDRVRYIGADSLRAQCNHSKRDGLVVVAVDNAAGTVTFKSPRWIFGYSVPRVELLPDKSPRKAAVNVAPDADTDELKHCYLWRIGDLVLYVGRDPELLKELLGAVPITRVLNPDRMLWVRRPSGLDVSVPMSDVEVVP